MQKKTIEDLILELEALSDDDEKAELLSSITIDNRFDQKYTKRIINVAKKIVNEVSRVDSLGSIVQSRNFDVEYLPEIISEASKITNEKQKYYILSWIIYSRNFDKKYTDKIIEQIEDIKNDLLKSKMCLNSIEAWKSDSDLTPWILYQAKSLSDEKKVYLLPRIFISTGFDRKYNSKIFDLLLTIKNDFCRLQTIQSIFESQKVIDDDVPDIIKIVKTFNDENKTTLLASVVNLMKSDQYKAYLNEKINELLTDASREKTINLLNQKFPTFQQMVKNQQAVSKCIGKREIG